MQFSAGTTARVVNGYGQSHSITENRDAIQRLFNVDVDLSGNLPDTPTAWPKFYREASSLVAA
jgi:hypothetical protein